MNFKNLLTNIFKKKETKENKENEIEVAPSRPEPRIGPYVGNIGIGAEKKWKFSEPEKQTIISWHAMGFSSYEVAEKAKDEMNLTISPCQVSVYTRAEKWQPLIKRIREATMNDLASVPGSHKKVRLQRHEKIYDRAIGKNKYDLALRATEAQRKEMEEGQINLTLNQFNVLSDDELKSKHEEVLNRIKMLSNNKGAINVVSANKTEAVGS